MDESVVLFAVVGIAVAALLLWLGVRPRRARARARARQRVDALPSTTAVRLTTHARERMAQRGVPLREVETTARAPHRVEADAEEGSVRLERDVDGDVLKVWVVAPWPPTDAAVVVKSTAWQRVVHGRIPRAAVGAVVGPRGATIQGIERRTGARISLDRASGSVRVTAGDRAAAQAALREVEQAARRA